MKIEFARFRGHSSSFLIESAFSPMAFGRLQGKTAMRITGPGVTLFERLIRAVRICPA